MKPAFLFLATAVSMFVLGCATPVTREEITPDLYELQQPAIAVAVVEMRPYVLSGDKSEKYEGLIRDGFGIPFTAKRGDRPDNERFVDFFGNLIKEGFRDVGVDADLVRVPKGTPVNEAQRQIPEPRVGRSVVIAVYESNWDAGGFKFRYEYDLDIHVYDIAGRKIAHKRFFDERANAPSGKHNVFDMHTVLYRETIETVFTEETIRGALQD